jgi:cytochrome c biogenesis protein
VVHLSLLLIMAGALLGGAGFVGTQQLYVGHSTTSYFDWDSQQDLPLGFEFRLDHFEPIYYPIHVRFIVNEVGSGRLLATLTAHEGDRVALPVPGFAARVDKFLPNEKRLILSLYREGGLLGAYDAFPVGNRNASAGAFGMTLHPDAFQDPLLQQLHSEVSVLRDGQVVKQGIIEVNRPLVFEGVTIYQTAFDQDAFGFWSAGFQMTRDPGKPLVWTGCVLLMVGFLLAFMARPQVLGIVPDGDRLLLVPLRGFVGEGGVQALAALVRSLGT